MQEGCSGNKANVYREMESSGSPQTWKDTGKQDYIVGIMQIYILQQCPRSKEQQQMENYLDIIIDKKIIITFINL